MNFNCYFSNSKPNLANGFQFMTNLITKCKRQMVKASTYTISRLIVSHELANKQVSIHRRQKPPAGNSYRGHKTDNIGRVMRQVTIHKLDFLSPMWQDFIVSRLGVVVSNVWLHHDFSYYPNSFYGVDCIQQFIGSWGHSGKSFSYIRSLVSIRKHTSSSFLTTTATIQIWPGSMFF